MRHLNGISNPHARSDFKTHVQLREQFNNRFGQAVSKLTPDERVIFSQRVEINRNNVLAYDDSSTRTFERQRNAQELQLQRQQNQSVLDAQEAARPMPPLMTNQELYGLAEDITNEQVKAGRARLDAEVRQDLNAHLARMTGMEDVLPESFEASRDFDQLDEMMAPYAQAPSQMSATPSQEHESGDGAGHEAAFDQDADMEMEP